MLIELLHELGQVLFSGHMVQPIHNFQALMIVLLRFRLVLVRAVTLEERSKSCPTDVTLFILLIVLGVLFFLQGTQPFGFIFNLFLGFDLLL